MLCARQKSCGYHNYQYAGPNCTNSFDKKYNNHNNSNNNNRDAAWNCGVWKIVSLIHQLNRSLIKFLFAYNKSQI